MPPSLKVYVHYTLYELDEKPNYIKISKSLNFEGKGYKEKEFSKKPFDKKIVFNGFKCLAWGVGHMCKKRSCQKTCLVVHWNSFLEFLGIFSYKPKYSYKIMYECENSSPPHEISQIGLLTFFSLNFVSSKCYLQKVAPQKSLNPFSFFGNPNRE